MNFHRLFLSLLLLVIAVPTHARSQDGSVNNQLRQFISAYVAELAAKGFRVESEIGNIDPRLHFGDCEGNLNFDFNRNPIEHAQTTVAVECDSNAPWQLFVRTEIRIYDEVVIAPNAIPRGSVIGIGMLDLTEKQINRGGYGHYSEAVLVEGMVAKRTIRAGSIIKPAMLQAPQLVSRGDQVVIVAANESINIRMNGTALSDGAKGEQISVRNNHSDRVIRAKVVKKGKVQVYL